MNFRKEPKLQKQEASGSLLPGGELRKWPTAVQAGSQCLDVGQLLRVLNDSLPGEGRIDDDEVHLLIDLPESGLELGLQLADLFEDVLQELDDPSGGSRLEK